MEGIRTEDIKQIIIILFCILVRNCFTNSRSTLLYTETFEKISTLNAERGSRMRGGGARWGIVMTTALKARPI